MHGIIGAVAIVIYTPHNERPCSPLSPPHHHKKQLGPMLEEMAVRSGGMFRLAKVNSDKNRGVSDVLQVGR